VKGLEDASEKPLQVFEVVVSEYLPIIGALHMQDYKCDGYPYSS
jgi:hypothetical protein